MDLEGIVVPLLTLFQEDRVDLAATRQHVRFLVAQGVHGLFVAGTTGEGPLLDERQRRELLHCVKESAGGSCPVLMSVAAIATADCCRACDLAAAEEADAVVVTTPYFYGFTQAEIRAHLLRLADYSRLPVVVYNIPQRTGNQITLPTMRALMEHHNIVAIKDSSPDLAQTERFMAAARPGVAVLAGDDALILPAMSAGAQGAVSGLANAFPEPFVALYHALRGGDWEQARHLQRRIVQVQAVILAESSTVAALKAALTLRGFPAGSPRAPILPLEATARMRLAAALTTAGVL